MLHLLNAKTQFKDVTYPAFLRSKFAVKPRVKKKIRLAIPRFDVILNAICAYTFCKALPTTQRSMAVRIFFYPILIVNSCRDVASLIKFLTIAHVKINFPVSTIVASRVIFLSIFEAYLDNIFDETFSCFILQLVTVENHRKFL